MTNCATLEAWIGSGSDPAALDAADLEHLLACERCRELWLTAALLAEARAEPVTRESRCPHSERVVALACDPAGCDERDALIDHAASCMVCLRELQAAARDPEALEQVPLASPPAWLEAQAVALVPPHSTGAVRSGTGVARWAPWLVAAAGLAAVGIGIGLIVVERAPWRSPPLAGDALRDDGVATPTALAPLGEVADRGSLRFLWSDPGATGAEPLGRRYHLVVVELTTGTTVMDVRTSETSYTPDAAQLDRFRSGVQYHWLVEPTGAGPGALSTAVVFWIAAE